MTMDGGLERLVRILHDYCLSPTPPENPAFIYGLSPPNSHPPKPTPSLNPKSFDKQAAYRFSLAFQCVVNIGVRGSEPIRSRVVQAGTLDVVGCILEAWLASKGFAVGPSTSASGMPRETREQRLARRQAQAEQRQREQAAQLARALQRQIAVEGYSGYDRTATATEDEPMRDATAVETPSSTVSLDADTSTDTSFTGTPARSSTPNGTVTVSARERSGTVIGRPTWEQTLTIPRLRDGAASGSASTDNSRPDTETEDDGDVDMDRDQTDTSPERTAQNTPHPRRAVGIVSDSPPPTAGPSLEVNADAHIIINNGPQDGLNEVGVEDGIVSLEANDDFAMGAPPGAPGAIDGNTPPTVPADEARGRGGQPDITPRAATTDLPALVPMPLMQPRGGLDIPRHLNATPAPGRFRSPRPNNSGIGHDRHPDGPYRDEDVLLSLQLLAYLSKYPHVRQHFYKTRQSFHPATTKTGPSSVPVAGPSAIPPVAVAKETNPILKAFASATGRGKEKEKATGSATAGAARQTNVFSLVERFTFRPSSSESELPNPPPTLPAEIQYWAGVIMRNACRKDESRGGIRQCANMLCGRWETFPREFAKCRRCRKAKYCGKECQSTAWSEGHRFWCSAKDPEEDGDHGHGERERERERRSVGAVGDGRASTLTTTTSGGTVTGRAERRAERERDRHRAALGAVVGNEAAVGADTARAVATAFRANGGDPNITLAALNGRSHTAVSPSTTTTTAAGNVQLDYLRMLNQRAVAPAEAASRRRSGTVPQTTSGSDGSDLPVQLRPYLIGPPTTETSTTTAGPSRGRGNSPRPPRTGDDVDMILG